MPSYTDQLSRSIFLSNTPSRIVSLVPSQTELLYSLGLNETVVGITKFCVHPNHWFNTKQLVGGTKQVNIQNIKALNPDLIIANKEENVKEQIEELGHNYPLWISDINDLSDALEMIRCIGDITEKATEAGIICQQIQERFNCLTPLSPTLRTVYLIWRKPYMTAGGYTFIHHILQQCGFENICAHQQRYPELSLLTLKKMNPQLVLLSSEPFPFKEKHIAALQEELPGSTILLVDGELFSWYGSRLLETPPYLTKLINKIRLSFSF